MPPTLDVYDLPRSKTDDGPTQESVAGAVVAIGGLAMISMLSRYVYLAEPIVFCVAFTLRQKVVRGGEGGGVGKLLMYSTELAFF